MKTTRDLLNVMRRQGASAARNDESIPGQPMLATMTSKTTCRAKDFNADFDADDLIFRQRDNEDMVDKVEIVGSTGETKPDKDHRIEYHAFEDANVTHYIQVTYNLALKKGDEVMLVPFGEKFLVLGRTDS